MLLGLYPEIYRRDCQMCLKFAFDEKTGRMERGRDGQPEPRLGNMGPSFLAPCRDPNQGCPKGTPENPRTLTEENETCLEHHRECVAIGRFPNDAVVRRNAAIIRDAESDVEKSTRETFQRDLLKTIRYERPNH